MWAGNLRFSLFVKSLQKHALPNNGGSRDGVFSWPWRWSHQENYDWAFLFLARSTPSHQPHLKLDWKPVGRWSRKSSVKESEIQKLWRSPKVLPWWVRMYQDQNAWKILETLMKFDQQIINDCLNLYLKLWSTLIFI